MQKKKKLLSLLLAVVFLLAMMVPVAYAEQFSDVPQDYRYYDAVENLAAKGIINGIGDGTYAPDANVKRSEFAKIVCLAILSTGEVAPADGAGFTDVPAEHWASGYIKVAAAAGIINGMGDGTFAPDNSVTYEQAVKMLVCALGYGDQALTRGGYPDGYLNMAGSLAMLKGISDGVIGQAANRGLIAKLVDTSMKVEVLDPVTGKTTGSVSDKDEKQSIKGQIVSIYNATIYADEKSDCGRQQIEIEKGSKRTTFSIEKLNVNISDYLGRMVTAYYNEESGADYYDITSLSLQKGKNKTTKIDMGSIDTYTDTEIEYLPTEDGEYEKASVDSDAKIIYNGRAVNTSLSKLIAANINNSGEITLLDAEGSGSASIVFIKTYETYVVNSVNKTKYTVLDKITGKTITLDIKDRAKTITFSKNGAAAEFDNIATNNILSVSTSDDGKLIDVIISANSSFSGTISEISSDCLTLKINNKEYKVAKSYESEAKNKFAFDVKATFYLDAFGKIAFADNFGSGASSTYKYAYLTGVEKEGATSDRVTVRLFDISGSSSLSAKTYSLADNVKLNGTSYKGKADQLMSALKDSAALLNEKGAAAKNAEEYTQIIKYAISGSEITKIVSYTGKTDRGNDDVLNVDNVAADGMKVITTNKIDKYSISGAKIIVIPKDDRIGGKYTGKSTSSFKIGSTYYTQMVDVNNTNIAKAVLVYETDDLTETDMEQITPSVVTSVSSTIKAPDGFDSDTVAVLKVKGLDGNEKEYYSDGSEKYTVMSGSGATVPSGSGNFKDLQPGDVIKVSADDNKGIDEIMLIAKADDIVNGNQATFIHAEGSNGVLGNAQHRYMLGSPRAIDRNDNSMIFTPMYADDKDYADETKDETFAAIDGNVLVYVVDTTQSKADNRVEDNTTFSGAEITAANSLADDEKDKTSRFLVYTSYSNIRMIVIFK